jgi:hypothetical protein
MNKIFLIFLISFFFISCNKDRVINNNGNGNGSDTTTMGTRHLIHYWNFNDTAHDMILLPNISFGGASIVPSFANVNDTIGYFDSYSIGTDINVKSGDQAGSCLRVRNPINDLVIAAPTTNYKNVILRFAISISSATYAPTNETLYYTIDGINYTNSGLPSPTYTPLPDPVFTLKSFDFSGISGVNNNPNFKCKIVFSNGNLNTKGNTRIDNVTFYADSLNATNSTDHHPVAQNDQFVMNQDTLLINTVATNDSASADGGNIYAIVTNPLHGSLNINANDGSFVYTPVSGYSGTDAFTYSITDIDGDSDTASVSITINAVAPPAGIELLHYWNFNNSPILVPNISIIAGASLVADYSTVTITPLGYIDSFPRTDTLIVNAQNGDLPGNSLRLRCPVTSMIMNLPTNNYKNIVVAFAVARSNSGPATDSVYYSIDGVNYINSGLTPQSFTVSADPAYEVHSYDFSSISGVNNNSNFKFKIVPVGADIATSGNNRFDNITVKGVHQ